VQVDWQIVQSILTVFGSGVAAYVAVSRRINGMGLYVRDTRLQQVKECEEHREKMSAETTKKVRSHESTFHPTTTNPGFSNPIDRV
jgi:hypothetical protein